MQDIDNTAQNLNGSVVGGFVRIPVRAEEPRIEVLRDGNVVKTIRVSCPCGCEFDIECNYSENGDKP